MIDAQVPSVGVPVLVYPARLRVLCVGGGVVATGKVRDLLDGGAQVRVIAPEVTATLREAADEGRLRWRRASYRSGDIDDATLVFAATGSSEVNAAVAADADAAGRLCVRVDDGPGGSAAMMGSVRRGPLVLGVATTGAAPALSRMVRRELADRYGPEHGVLAELSAELRSDPRVVVALADLDVETRRARWRGVYHPDILDLVRAGRLDQAKEAAFACLLSSSD